MQYCIDVEQGYGSDEGKCKSTTVYYASNLESDLNANPNTVWFEPTISTHSSTPSPFTHVRVICAVSVRWIPKVNNW